MNIQFRLQNSIAIFNAKKKKKQGQKAKNSLVAPHLRLSRSDEKQQPAKYSHLSKISLGKNASAALQCCSYHLLKETLVGNSSPRPSFPASNFCWKRSNKKIDVSTFMYVIMKQYH